MMHDSNKHKLDEEVNEARAQLQDLKKNVVKAGNNVRHALDDAWITARIKAALLKESLFKGFELGVGTEAGGVRLTGDLDTLDQVIAAESIAAGIPGVRRVYNDLRVKPRI